MTVPGINAQFPQPLECLFRPKRYKVLWGGRGAGRSWGVARALLLMGIERPLRVLCAREFQNSISESVHKLLSDQILALGLTNLYNIEVARITGPGGTSFVFEGIRNNTSKIKSYEGIDICWVEEAIKVSRNSWGILIPTIRKESSEIWMTFNPELDTDYTYVRFVKEADPNSSFVVKMTWRDNPWFPQVLRDEMEDLRKRDYDAYLNIWEGHTIQVVEGSVYARELRKAQEEGRICHVPYEPEVPVCTFWDLGRADKTAIWFAQRVAMQYRILGYYEASALNIPMDDATGGVMHFAREVQRRGYAFEAHYLPHDGKAKRLGSKRTIQEMLTGLFRPAPVYIVPKQSVADGINAVRLLLPQCWFDEDSCADGLSALRRYKYAVKDGQLSNEPVHDDASDGADAFRTLALAYRGPRPEGENRVLAGLRRAKELVMVSSSRPDGPPSGLGWMS